MQGVVVCCNEPAPLTSAIAIRAAMGYRVRGVFGLHRACTVEGMPVLVPPVLVPSTMLRRRVVRPADSLLCVSSGNALPCEYRADGSSRIEVLVFRSYWAGRRAGR